MSDVSASQPTEALFYHLERQPLETVLPQLLLRTLERGWRAVVEAGSEERLEALDAHLWTFDEHSFLPHGRKQDGHPERQPIFLTTGPENPNGATVRFLVDGAAPPDDLTGYVRLVLMFDGRDTQAVANARDHWRVLKGKGCAVTYWQQADRGGWERKA
jgi:DNA polymerase-3 subunit chi